MSEVKRFQRGALGATWLILGLLGMAPAPVWAQEAAFKPEDVSEQPKIADAAQARTAIDRSYSSSLQNAGIQGRVQVAFVVNADGSVDTATISVLSAPTQALGRAAEAAISRIKFRPAMKDGQPVRCEASLAVTYQLGS